MCGAERSSASFASMYARKCEEQGINPCFELLDALKTGSSAVCVRGKAATPFLAALASGEASQVTTIDLSGERLPREAVYELAAALRAPGAVAVSSLNLAKAKIGDGGWAILLAALCKSGSKSALRNMNLRGNRLSRASAKAIASALVDNPDKPLRNLRSLDVSDNNMGHRGVQVLRKASESLPSQCIELQTDGNLLVIETLNSITHGIGVLSAIGAGSALVFKALPILPLYQTVSVALFCIALLSMFLFSCLYHSFFRFPLIRELMHTADHCSIFLLIAGSYTPFVACYALEPPNVVGPSVLVAVWVCAVIGILMSFRIISASRTVRALFALAMGWIGILPIRMLLERMPVNVIARVVGGGLAYSGGIVFYIFGKKNPVLHVVWHLAVMLGGSLHYMALWVHCNAQAA